MRILWLTLVAVLLGSSACAAGGKGTVVVLASWTGTEQAEFQRVLDAFQDKTGTGYDYRGSRALDQVLASDVERGTAPDVAVLPNPGSLAAYVRQGKLQPLDADLEEPFGKRWATLEKAGTGKTYAVPVKADLKSAIWFAPGQLPGSKPATWAELLTLSRKLTADGRTPWCLGMGAPPTSGWPGTDWIEDILLHTAGPDVYRRWAAGKLAWTSPEIRAAWKAWGDLVSDPKAVLGGGKAALLTDFGDAGRGLFAPQPTCLLEHQASFIMGNYLAAGSSPKPVSGFDFFPTPGPQISEVSADLAGMFRDTPQARSLMRFLASDEAQRIWPSVHRGSVFSASRNVTDVYEDRVSQRVASKLTEEPVCFDASDLMPATMTGAFYQAVQAYLDNPARLDTLLGDLDKVRLSAALAGQWLDVPCGQ